MFTVKVERADGTRQGYACWRYDVGRPNGDAVELTLHPDPTSSLAVTIKRGERAFVMNGDGSTVDIVRWTPQAVSA